MKKEISINILKSDLYSEIGRMEDSKQSLEECETKKILLENIIASISGTNFDQILKNMLVLDIQLALIYGKNTANKIMYKLYDIIYNLKGLEKSLTDRELLECKDYYILLKRFASLRNLFEKSEAEAIEKIAFIKETYDLNTMIQSRRILSNLKYKQKITDVQITELVKVLSWNGYSSDDRLRAVETIRLHNKNINNDRLNAHHVSKTPVLEMLDKDFQEYEEVYIDDINKRNIYERNSKTLKSLIENAIDEKDMEEYIYRPSESEEYDQEEFNYVMINNIDNLKNQMLELIETVKEEEFYVDSQCREEIIRDYEKIKRKYNRLRYIYNVEKNIAKKSEEKKEELPIVNNIFYASKGENTKSYFEQDIEDVTKENLERVEYLVNGFRTDTLKDSENKPLTNNNRYKGYLELKQDQIRILYRHINNNNYLIVGIGTKKADNDLFLYNKMTDRNSNIDISTTDKFSKEMVKAEIIRGKVISYIEENKRIGNR